MKSIIAGVLLCSFLAAAAEAQTKPITGKGGGASGPADGGGGQYGGPADSGTPNAPQGGTPLPKPTTPVVGSGQGIRPASLRGDTRGNPRLATRGISGRRGRAFGDRTLSVLPDGWERWWELNEERILQLRSEPAPVQAVSGRLGGFPLGRQAQRIDTGLRRPDQEEVLTRILPALLELTVPEEEDEVVVEAVFALARMTPARHGAAVAQAAERLLGHSSLAVRSRATLALGVLGGTARHALLVDLFRGNAAGQRAVGGGTPRNRVRAMAALALGMQGADPGVDALLQAVQEPSEGDFEVTVCALVGLSRLPRESSRRAEVRHILEALLLDPRGEDLIRAHAATALGALGEHEAVPALLTAFVEHDLGNLVRQATAGALGRLGRAGDPGLVAALLDEVRVGRDAPTRRLALIGLGDVGGRDLQPYGRFEAHQQILEQLHRELIRDGKSPLHRSWAALGLALYARQRDDVQPWVGGMLLEAYEDEREMPYRSSFGLSLGLIGEFRASPMVYADFENRREADARGYAAMSLGLLGHKASRPALRALALDAAREGDLRRRATRGLGLSEDADALPELLAGFDDPRTESLALALGVMGDGRAVEALLELAADRRRTSGVRAAACAALGRLAEKTELPWNAEINPQYNDRSPIPALESILGIL